MNQLTHEISYASQPCSALIGLRVMLIILYQESQQNTYIYKNIKVYQTISQLIVSTNVTRELYTMEVYQRSRYHHTGFVQFDNRRWCEKCVIYLIKFVLLGAVFAQNTKARQDSFPVQKIHSALRETYTIQPYNYHDAVARGSLFSVCTTFTAWLHQLSSAYNSPFLDVNSGKENLVYNTTQDGLVLDLC